MKFKVTVKTPHQGDYDKTVDVTVEADQCEIGTIGELFFRSDEQAVDGGFDRCFAPGVWLHVRVEPEK